jgi:anti-sigma factor (TIGR02949 family)
MSEHTSAGSYDHCEHVLERMYEFLDHEIDTASGEAIRHHLAACEPCMDQFDVELAVRTLVRRCCRGEVAPSELRSKIVAQLTVIRRTL